LSHTPLGPTPVGLFRSVERPSYESEMAMQLSAAESAKGPGDLAQLLTSVGTWTVE